MVLISHRGNLKGKQLEKENQPEYVLTAIDAGFDVEIDVWCIKDQLFLGHDKPQYNVRCEWIVDLQHKLWLHCKNIEAILFFKNMQTTLRYFWHENDTLTLTSHGDVWVYPGKQPVIGSISVLPEMFNDDITFCKGVCSDYIERYS